MHRREVIAQEVMIVDQEVMIPDQEDQEAVTAEGAQLAVIRGAVTDQAALTHMIPEHEQHGLALICTLTTCTV